MICQPAISQRLTDSVENFFRAFSTDEQQKKKQHNKKPPAEAEGFWVEIPDQVGG